MPARAAKRANRTGRRERASVPSTVNWIRPLFSRFHPQPLWWRVGLLPLASLMVCAWASLWVARHQAPTDFPTAVWATLVLASFAGWGRLWHRLVLPELRVSWPL